MRNMEGKSEEGKEVARLGQLGEVTWERITFPRKWARPAQKSHKHKERSILRAKGTKGRVKTWPPSNSGDGCPD